MDCGCKVTAKYRSSGLVTDIEFTDAEWIMCPLHKAAPKLMKIAQDFWTMRLANIRGVEHESINLDTIANKVRDALALAKGESK